MINLSLVEDHANALETISIDRPQLRRKLIRFIRQNYEIIKPTGDVAVDKWLWRLRRKIKGNYMKDYTDQQLVDISRRIVKVMR